MIRAFIFDIGNVLLRFDFSIAMRKLQAKSDPISEAVLAALEKIKWNYESGRIDRKAFHQELGALLRYTGTQDEFVSAWEDIFTENWPMMELVKKLHGHFPLYLLSNISDIHEQYIFRRYPAFKLFTDGVFSYRVRCAKPDPEIYRIAIEQFKIVPAETVFIDDLPQNIKTAKQGGISAFQYDHEQHERLTEWLLEQGLPREIFAITEG